MLATDAPLKPFYPVLVVGAGSVGLSMAAELGWRGIECLAVEQRDGLNPHPRANAVANRTMEYFRRWGIDQAISESGIPPHLPADYHWVSTLKGKPLHKISLPPLKQLLETRKSGGYAKDEHAWSPYLKTTTGQNEVERAILGYVERLEAVDFRFGWRLAGFEQDADGVTCRLVGGPDGEVRTVRCRYLVACDGGRSAVREALGIGLEGRAALARFVSIYFRAPDFIGKHRFGHGNIYFPLHRDHRGFILNWDGGTTYTYHLILPDGRDWTSVDPQAAIDGVVGQPVGAEIVSVQPWTAHALVARRYRDGNVFLAGDAAHLFTPTGGFGMNTGVSDAIDLTWKLQAMLESWGGPALLDSYDRERRPVGVRNTAEAADCFDRLFAVMGHGDELDAETPESEALRAALGVDLKDQEKLIASSGTLLGYRYNDSDIVVPDGTPEPPDHPRTYQPVARPGHRAPHLWLDDGSALYDRFGPCFTLLVLGAGPADVAPVEQAARRRGMPLAVARVAEPAAETLYGARFVLVRPDLMVAWRAGALPDDAGELLDIVRGARMPSHST